jgi:competence protein ComEC
VISVGATNPYGHPGSEVLSRLRDAGAAVYRTDLHGNVLVVTDATTYTAQPQRYLRVRMPLVVSGF